ncbi:MAG: di-trans,poly-cis-decaprenylcistransferase [Alphaproteobacteria bacterium]|nr:di-trans,poly-cis-decaprenylcistransferase [Alphaproteobacteria bacterium]
MQNLSHIAFIMDGNRRWAKKKGLPLLEGHKQGARTLMEIAKAVKNLGVKYMTVYAFSTENWSRDKAEVDGLMGLLRQYINEDFKQLQENNARIIFIGERQMLADDIVAKMAEIEKESQNNDGITICVALSYGGRQEIAAAACGVARDVKDGKLALEDINAEIFEKYLYTAGIPSPDLMIRTSGEMRISNYLLWQLAYSEFYFSEKLWPDFSEEDLKTIIEEYNLRERRYGKL